MALPAGIMRVGPLHEEEHKERHAAFRLYHEKEQHSRIFDRIRGRVMLNPIESAYALHVKNKKHASRLSNFEGELPEKISTLMLICADARMGGMLDFDDFARRGILPVYVAGNVSEIFNTPGMKEIFSRMGRDSSIVIVGHAKCGAVHCAGERHKFEKFRNISKLLNFVKHTSELDNLAAQARELGANENFRKAAAKKGVRITTAFVDIAHERPSIRIADESTATAKDGELISHLNAQFIASNEGQDLSERQYAHAIVISGHSLPFDPREIFDCKANEIFCVTAGDFGKKKPKGRLSGDALASVEAAALGLLDEKSIASVEYSITANSSRHILLLHTNTEVLKAWEEELLKKSEIVTRAVIDGTVEITTAVYVPTSGMVVPTGHLINEPFDSAAQSFGLGL